MDGIDDNVKDVEQHWSVGFDGPWFSGLSCSRCGALIANTEHHARLHRRWHEEHEEHEEHEQHEEHDERRAD